MFSKEYKSLRARIGSVFVLLHGLVGAGMAYPVSAAGGDVTRVSLADDESQPHWAAGWPILPADGRYSAFYSDASNLVPGDTNGMSDVFVSDIQAGTTRRVSLSSSGAQANVPSYAAAMRVGEVLMYACNQRGKKPV